MEPEWEEPFQLACASDDKVEGSSQNTRETDLLYRSLLNCSSKTQGLTTAQVGPAVTFRPLASKKVLQGSCQQPA